LVYVFLVLLALIFASLGFFVHAFYLGSPDNGTLSKETHALKEKLEEKQKEVEAARDELLKTGTVARSLEEQIRQRNEEMEAHQQMVARQDREIRQLQEDAAALHAALGVGENYNATAVPQSFPALTDPSQAGPPAGLAPLMGTAPEQSMSAKSSAGQEVVSIPEWKDNLNNILNILNSMEKEIDK
jgi:predicted ribosome quality control (RQC) complex YloA/Tae2 family protein